MELNHKANLKKIPLIWFLLMVTMFVLGLVELGQRKIFVDETFFLKISYAQHYQKDIQPILVTPFTAIVGPILKYVNDIKVVLISLRYLNLALLFGLFLFLPYVVGYMSALVCVSMFLLNAVDYLHLTHARYDNIVFLSLFLFAFLIKKETIIQPILYVVLLFLFTTGLTGLFFSVPVHLFYLHQYFVGTTNTKNCIRKIYRNFFFLFLAFLGVLWSMGLMEPYLRGYYDSFWWSQSAAAPKIYFLSELNVAVKNSILFYFLGGVSLYHFLRRDVFSKGTNQSFFVFVASALTLALLYFLRQPSPAIFMLCGFNLILCVLLALHCREIFASVSKKPVMVFLFVLASVFQVIHNPWIFRFGTGESGYGVDLSAASKVVDSYRSLIESQNATMFDPSGLFYYARPCHFEWYLDTPLSFQVTQKKWMSNFDMTTCDYAAPLLQVTNMSVIQVSQLASRFTLVSDFLYKNDQSAKKLFYESSE
jgi:hypothetical protein